MGEITLISVLLTVAGLCLFETIISVDNAVNNADVLSSMSQKGRRWFLIWGLLFAVVVVHRLLPWLIAWKTAPSLGPLGALIATFSNEPKVKEAIDAASPILLAGGGTFLLFLFFIGCLLSPRNTACVANALFIRREFGFML